jgi:acetoin utilization deacetylase AcuC-like enzyme
MEPSAAIHVVEDARYREHEAPSGHPEHPDRLAAVAAALAGRRESLVAVEARPASASEILRVHDEAHLRQLEQAAARGPAQLDADTYVSPRSHEVALLAAGGAVELASRIARGEARCGIAAVRPPGHHAEAERAMGFCLLNNVAIAARALQAEAGLDKLLVIDWDVHHGNGTQHSFEDDPSVLYASTHQFPYYPGTGDAGEAGRGRGLGATLNIPLPAGCGDAEYIGVFQRLLVPAVHDFSPQMILVSCGFDAHRDDPLASMALSRDGFTALTRIVRVLADELCGGRLCFVLEGGYAASGLVDGTHAVLDAVLEPTTTLPAPIEMPAGSTLRSVVDRVASVQAAFHPGIGAS